MSSTIRILLLGFLSIISAPVYAQAGSDTASSLRSANAVRDLQGDFPEHALTRLIEVAERIEAPDLSVELAIDWTPEGYLSEDEVAEQRARIAEAQAAIIEKFGVYGRREDIYSYESIPNIEVRYSREAVALLADSQAARQIAVAPPVYPMLDVTRGQVEAQHLYARGYTGSGWVVAIVDTGVNATHPGLAGKVVAEACFSTNGTNLTSTCPGGVTSSTAPGSGVACGTIGTCAHGTRMAGVIASNYPTLMGVAPDVNILPIQAASKGSGCGGGKTICFMPQDIAKALNHVYNLRAQFNFAAVNMSLGTDDPTYSGTCNSLNGGSVANQAANLRSVGIIPVAATGNGGSKTGISWPACVSSVVAVGSVDRGSNVVSTISNSHSLVELLAPGGNDADINTTGADGNNTPPGNGTGGTSAAAAHVSGAIAAMRSGFADAVGALKSAGIPVTDSANGVTRPALAMDLAMPPAWTTIASQVCYGYTDVNWSGVPWASAPANPYYSIQLQQVGWSGWQDWTTSVGTYVFLDVPYDAYVRVRLCDGTRCGGGRQADGYAKYYPYCP